MFSFVPSCPSTEMVKHIVAWCRHMATQIWVNIGSGNGLLPDGTKPLPEPMLTHQWVPVPVGIKLQAVSQKLF